MDNLRGALLMTLSMLGFAFEDMLIKLLGNAVPIGQIILFLGLGGAVVFAVVVILRGERLFTAEMASPPIVLRALGEFGGAICFVSAIVLTPLSSASAILQATPLIVTMAAALFLGEPVGWRRWTAIFVGLGGVLLIIRPGMDSFEILSLLAFGGVIGLAMRDVATRKVPKSISSMQLSFLGFAAMIPAGPATMWIYDAQFQAMDLSQWSILSVAMIVGLFAYYAIVAAMRIGDVGFVTPFRYSRLLFALIFGVVIFGERPDMLTLLGSAIVVSSGLYTIFREGRRRAPKVM